MALYNNIVTRGTSYPDAPGAGGANLVPIEQANAIISAVPTSSAALKMFTHVPMSSLVDRVPVLSVLPQASFVSGEATGTYGAGSGLKPTTAANWVGRYLQAEEIACILPIPENLLADSQYDIFGQLTPHIAAKIGQALDAAIFFGQGKPPSYPQPIVDAALAVGNSVVAGTAAQSAGALAADIANLIAEVENDGFDVDGAIAKTTLRAQVRNARMTTGQELSEIQVNEWYGQPVEYAMRGLWPQGGTTVTGNTTSGSPTVTGVNTTAGLSAGDAVSGTGVPANAAILSVDTPTQFTLDVNATAAGTATTFTAVAPKAIVGDFSQGLLGVRQDITWKILDQAALFDQNGVLQINLPQQDAVAIRVVARFGFAVANVATYDQPNESLRYPFAALLGA